LFRFRNTPTGLPCSAQIARARKIPPLRRWCCLSACSYQAEEQPTTSRFGSSLSVAFSLFDFTTFNSGSLTLIFWPSLAPQPDCDFQYHTRPLAGHGVPRKVATLSVRSARDRCQPRTVPRLPVAEYRVLSCLEACKTTTYAACAALLFGNPSRSLERNRLLWLIGLRTALFLLCSYLLTALS
jgi:hypothetical protein